MPQYRRVFRPGGTYFFTVVTEGRAPILTTPLARPMLHDAIAHCRASRPFTVDALVLLPDHFHLLCTLPPGDDDYSTRIASIKAHFTRAWLEAGGAEGGRSASRVRHRRRGVWQRRFWEHTIRDEADLEAHFHYTHYNPVKHRYVRCPHAWEWSTFSRAVERSIYDRTWHCACDGRRPAPPTFEDLDVAAME